MENLHKVIPPLFPSKLVHPIDSRFDLEAKMDKIISNLDFKLPTLVFYSSSPFGDKK